MKNFITLDNVPCWRDNEIRKGHHILCGGVDYVTTNAQYLENGDFYFELWYGGEYIGKYIIYKQFLNLIKEIHLAESE